jgi:hypothetical protein
LPARYRLPRRRLPLNTHKTREKSPGAPPHATSDSNDCQQLPIRPVVDAVIIRLVLGTWRRLWPPLAGIAIGLMVAHALRDRRAAPGTVDLEHRRTPATAASVMVPELAPAGRPVHGIRTLTGSTP